jgi:serine acetyltransferase
VVTHDVPDHMIVAGNPARVIGDVRSRPRESATSSNALRRDGAVVTTAMGGAQ